MAVPKSRHTKSKRNRRRAHIYLKAPALSICPHCNKPVRSHTVCHYCGYYGGRQVIDVLGKLEKKERKKREKEIGIKGKEREGETRPGLLDWKRMSKK